MIAALLVVTLAQAMPPPLGQGLVVLMLGTRMLPAAPAATPPADCNCGVPSSPRGPR